MVACTVPCSTPGGFGVLVDGANFVGGVSTSCTLFSFDSNGHLVRAASFQTSAPQYDQFLGIDAAGLPDLGHTTLRCLLPARGGGALWGVTFDAPTAATGISTSTVACQPVAAASTELRHTENGTYTEGTTVGGRIVTCTIPRSPLAFDATSGTFYLTGDNRDGMATTLCGIGVYNYTGDFITSSSFVTSAAHWVQPVSLPAAQLPYWSYTSVSCILPGTASGDLESAIALSPRAASSNINTHAAECQTQSWPQDNLLHSADSVETDSTTASNTWISCGVPRSPLASGAQFGYFYVDGDNFNGASTVCDLESYDFNGTLLGVTAFSSQASSYDQLLSLPAAQLPFRAYVGIECLLPAHGMGDLRGVTSLQ
jgi:hypothetical protein